MARRSAGYRLGMTDMLREPTVTERRAQAGSEASAQEQGQVALWVTWLVVRDGPAASYMVSATREHREGRVVGIGSDDAEPGDL